MNGGSPCVLNDILSRGISLTEMTKGLFIPFTYGIGVLRREPAGSMHEEVMA